MSWLVDFTLVIEGTVCTWLNFIATIRHILKVDVATIKLLGSQPIFQDGIYNTIEWLLFNILIKLKSK